MGFSLIETLRWEPGAGLVRGDRHLDRMARSACELGFAFDRAAARIAIEKLAGGAAQLRVRAELSEKGELSVGAVPYFPVEPGKVWRLRIAATRLASGNPMLRHKTTLRQSYVRARSEFDVSQADEVILLNERSEVCEGTITNIFLRDRPKWILATPPLSAGLVDGVLRSELIAMKMAVEETIIVDRLTDAHEVFVGNSLRGLIPARIDFTD
jgi:4-amino-4-deoxychorismate lyase